MQDVLSSHIIEKIISVYKASISWFCQTFL